MIHGIIGEQKIEEVIGIRPVSIDMFDDFTSGASFSWAYGGAGENNTSIGRGSFTGTKRKLYLEHLVANSSYSTAVVDSDSENLVFTVPLSGYTVYPHV